MGCGPSNIRETPSYKLSYFDITGRAEPIRIALTAAGVEFEDVRFGFADWFASIKATTPMGQVPILEVDDVPITQAIAILVYAGKLAKIYPEDDLSALKVDEMHGIVNDISGQFFAFNFNPDAEARTALGEKFVAEVLPNWATSLEKLFASREQTEYAVGTSLTTADLALWNAHNFIVARDAAEKEPVFERITEEFQKYPTLLKIVKNVDNHEIVKAYYAAKSA